MSEHVSWRPVEPFDVDHGQLDGLSPAEIFSLGVEWQLFRAWLQNTPDKFEYLIHAQNADRLVAMCNRQGRKATVHWLHDDFEQWRTIHVDQAPPKRQSP